MNCFQVIKSIFDIFDKIIYEPPYSILFGRISISKLKPNLIDINDIWDGMFLGYFNIFQAITKILKAKLNAIKNDKNVNCLAVL